MSYQITLDTRPAQPAAVIRAHVAFADLAAFLQLVFPEVEAALRAQNVTAAGPPVALYEATTDGFDISAGFPVPAPIGPTGRIAAITLPGGLIASTLHTGTYENLPCAYQALDDWLASHGYQPGGQPWESYLDHPNSRRPRTIVSQPCRRT